MSPHPPCLPHLPPRPAATKPKLAPCVSITNSFRASESRAALARAARLDTYAADAARHDGTLREAHQYVKDTPFRERLVRAENELLWWPLSTYAQRAQGRGSRARGDVQRGPNGEHRRNMIGDYGATGCGIFVNGGEVMLA